MVYITKEEWSEELRKLFEDIHDSGVEGDNEDDSERYVSRNILPISGFSRVFYSLDVLEVYGPQDTVLTPNFILLDNPNLSLEKKESTNHLTRSSMSTLTSEALPGSEPHLYKSF